jgi:ferric-dicitrate binding protein FerR (iron transport regulator)
MALDPEQEFDDAALARYFAGESDDREEVAIGRRIAADPEYAGEIARLRDVWEASAGEQPDIEAALAKVTGGGSGRQVLRLPRVAGAERAWWSRMPWAVAAAVLVAIGSAGMWRVVGSGEAEMRMRELATPAGSRATITLKDGTRLVLGPATHLRVAAGFGRDERVVELDGEAVFAVVHDTRRPFVVRTARGDVRDVGTTFTVLAYRGDRDVHVAVQEGAVEVAGTALGPRDVAALDSTGRITVRRGVDVSRYFGWTQGGLAFEDTPLRQAVRELARTYDLTITIADSALAGKLVTASFTNEPLDEVLDAVTRVVGGHYERTGRVVVIRRSLVPVQRPGRTGSQAMRVTRAN